MNERLKKIRLYYKMSQEEFGKKIGIESRAHISALENGSRNITDRIIKDVCREFGITKEWMLNGTGEMLKEMSDDIAEAASDLIEEDNPFYDLIIGIMKTYKKLDPTSQAALRNLSQELLDKMKEGD